jgi:hypothetical protein
MNGIWLLILLGRWSMATGWVDLFVTNPSRNKREFVSVDARLDDFKKDTRSYEMLSRDSGKTMDDAVTPSVVTPISPVAKSPFRSPSVSHGAPVASMHQPTPDGRRTPDYFGNTQRYHTPARSFSSPRPPQTVTWDPEASFAKGDEEDYVNPLGMNRI